MRHEDPDVKLHAIYRSSPGQNRKNRPEYFDKRVALASFLRAWRELPGAGTLIFLNDGEIPAARRDLMLGHGDVRDESGLGNGGSYRRAVAMAVDAGFADDDLVYLVEDDYLHLPDAFGVLVAAAPDLAEASYFTLYDHPDRYTRRDDAEGGASRVRFAGGRHWRTVESTCLTFAARASVLRRDLTVHRRAARAEIPDDRALWHAVQGLGRYPFRRRRHRLMSPMPALATHLESEYLAPGVDWAAVARDAAAWGERAGG